MNDEEFDIPEEVVPVMEWIPPDNIVAVEADEELEALLEEASEQVPTEKILVAEEAGEYYSYSELVGQITTTCYGSVIAWQATDSDYNAELFAGKGYISSSITRAVVSCLDILVAAFYRDTIAAISHPHNWKEAEDGLGNIESNLLPYAVALDMIETAEHRSHVTDAVSEFFDGAKEEELCVVSIDMNVFSANRLIPTLADISPHSQTWKPDGLNALRASDREYVEDFIPGLIPQVDNLDEIGLYEYNVLVHAFGAAMAYGYIYLLDFSDDYCTFVCRNETTAQINAFESFPDAMQNFIETKGHLIRNPVRFNASFSASHGVLVKAIEKAATSKALRLIDKTYQEAHRLGHEAEITDVKMQMKAAMNGSSNAFGWS